MMNIVIGILIPFFGTSLGSLLVYFIKTSKSKKTNAILYGLSSGIMLSSSIWSLIIPSLKNSDNYYFYLPCIVGYVFGILFLIIIEVISLRITKFKMNKTNKMLMAVSIHNIPEGMAVGVMFSSVLYAYGNISLSSAFILSIGIAIQNIPEGAVVSLPLCNANNSKNKSFLCGVLSGIVEPIFAILTIIFINKVRFLFSYLLAFAAGAMIYVVVFELFSEIFEDKKSGVISFVIGFIFMMFLDVFLG